MLEKSWTLRCVCGLALLALAASPALADDMVTNGADLWRTVAAGATFSSFAEDPIPADFFCAGSPAFEGRITMRGEPLATTPAGVLGGADTIVRRLDDTAFDTEGTARTRIQLMALSLASEKPVDVGCEQPFDVAVSLAGEQPMTEMTIFRESEKGGTYVAPLALRVRLTFTPIDDPSSRLELTRDIDLGPGTNSYWATTAQAGTDIHGNPVQVDTDGDGTADSALPGPSNFHTGLALTQLGGGGGTGCQPGYCLYQTCHCNPNGEDPFEDNGGCSSSHMHCNYVCVPAELMPGGICVEVSI